MKLINFFNRIISTCFYLLFFLVPLVFSGDTSELFELNKMWLTYILTIIIILFWGIKMVVQKRFFVQRTLLDIPIILFFISQFISTIFSLDRYVSFWGYYARFNGGLLSTISYILLYYAFVSNLEKKHVRRLLQVSLFSGLVVALWGLPAHFGYDPTCYVFRGTFDVSCWTDAFQPKVRIFSTLGQPDWMAAYMAVLIPIAVAFGIMKNYESRITNYGKSKYLLLTTYYFLLTALFYIDLLFTKSRSGFIAIAISLFFFFIYYFWSQRKKLKNSLFFASGFLILIACITFIVGTSVNQIDKFMLTGLQTQFAAHQQTQPTAVPQPKKISRAIPVGELGGTDSGKIRLFVWQGALKIWEHYPIFGTGVETFAFGYYMFRPAGHNLTSEWDYLYNKAHNEYLNYLATTGIFGLGTYMAIILLFLFLAWKYFPRYVPDSYKHQQQMLIAESAITKDKLLVVALISSFLSILISNFFGFSVVIINIYFFIIPGCVLYIEHCLQPKRILSIPTKITQEQKISVGAWQYATICIMVIIGGFFSITLIRYWFADKAYAYGYNLDHAGYYQQANSFLRSAVEEKPQEPVFMDELSADDAILATEFAPKNATTAAKFAQESLQLSNKIIQDHPNNIVYWKTRVRIFYSLAQLNSQYTPYAVQAIQKAHELAPTDAKIAYNLGLLYAQTGNMQAGIQTMQQTIALKPDYQDAYYALALFYRQSAIDKNGTVINKDAEQKAVEEMHFILNNFDPKNQDVLKQLKDWGEQ